SPESSAGRMGLYLRSSKLFRPACRGRGDNHRMGRRSVWSFPLQLNWTINVRGTARWAAELVSEVRRDSQQVLDEIALGLVKGRKQFGPSVRCLCQCPLLTAR